MNAHDETLAALDEGIAALPDDLAAVYHETIAMKAEAEKLQARIDAHRETLKAALTDHGLVGYMVDGKVHVRVKHGTRSGIDVKTLRKDMPSIAAKYTTTTEFTSITVS